MSDGIPEFVKHSVPWNPWHGCRRVSEGCLNCYMFQGDAGRGVEGSDVVRRSKTQFDLPLRKDRNGRYKLRDSLIIVSLTSDFFIEEADEWRDEAWSIMRRRRDALFEIPTKRPERILEHLPADWGEGYPNVRLAVSVENQRTWDLRVPILCSVPAKRHDVFLAPMIGPVDCDPLLSVNRIDGIYLGGEICDGARVCDYAWVLQVRDSCIRNGVTFHWRNCGRNLLRDGELLSGLTLENQGRICTAADLDHIVDEVLPPVRQTTLF
ncbi:MAG: phage Gp37/Gp68 family protein [archaeon]|nr:phage Gp37/Gp68 family protein [archaeon]